MGCDIRLAMSGIDPEAEVERFRADYPEAGAIVSFLGQVRAGQGVEALDLRHYGPLTLPGIEQLGLATETRWNLIGLLIVHRVGEMVPGEPIVLVAAASRHRRDAFAAADYAMDHLKSESWFWKREKANGAWRWVEPREQDFEDLSRWG